MPQEIHNLKPHSLSYKREENRAVLTFVKTSGAVTRDRKKNGRQLTGARAAEFC